MMALITAKSYLNWCKRSTHNATATDKETLIELKEIDTGVGV